MAAEHIAEVLKESVEGVGIAVTRARLLLGDPVGVTSDAGFALGSIDTDVAQFERLVVARTGDRPLGANGSSASALAQLLGLWRGEAYGEFASEDWARPEVTRLTALKLALDSDAKHTNDQRNAPNDGPQVLPSGTVTFLFTDIEGSTRRWKRDPKTMGANLALHDQILQSTIRAHGGYIFSAGGDGFAAAFSDALSALRAANDVQAAVALPVRMGLHTGDCGRTRRKLLRTDVEPSGSDHVGGPRWADPAVRYDGRVGQRGRVLVGPG